MKLAEFPSSLARLVQKYRQTSRPCFYDSASVTRRATTLSPFRTFTTGIRTSQEPIAAAPAIDFGSEPFTGTVTEDTLMRLRVVPASPSYFTGKPDYTDNLLALQDLLRKYATLPVVRPGEAPRVAWRTLTQYRAITQEPVRASRYTRIVAILHRLNHIHPDLMPADVAQAIRTYKRDVDPFANKPIPEVIDEFGRAKGIGRRKSSSAKVWLVEGDGEVLINGKTLAHAFGRVHDRESAIWALKATQRIDKYNVFALVNGGGTTGQAEALALGVAKALMVHEPLLKVALRRGKHSRDCQTAVFSSNSAYSRLRCTRPQTRREEEAWQAQGSQDARLGQEMMQSCMLGPIHGHARSNIVYIQFPHSEYTSQARHIINVLLRHDVPLLLQSESVKSRGAFCEELHLCCKLYLSIVTTVKSRALASE